MIDRGGLQVPETITNFKIQNDQEIYVSENSERLAEGGQLVGALRSFCLVTYSAVAYTPR